MIKTFFKFLGWIYLRQIRRVEKKFGYRLAFPNIPSLWINGFAVFNLTKNWKQFGLHVKGIDYFTMGSLDLDGVSTRYDRQSTQYQSWLGGYLVHFSKAERWNIEDHIDLAVVDQIDWLRHLGDPYPICELHAAGFKEIEKIEISGYQGKLYIGGGMSHSDTGERSRSLGTHLEMAFMAALFNLSNSRLNVSGASFMPKTPGSYESVYLKCCVAILEIDKGIQAVLYGNAAIFKNASGKEIDTFEPLKNELLAALNGIVIEKI